MSVRGTVTLGAGSVFRSSDAQNTVASGQTLTITGPSSSQFTGALAVSGTLDIQGSLTVRAALQGSAGTLKLGATSNAGVTYSIDTALLTGTWTSIGNVACLPFF